MGAGKSASSDDTDADVAADEVTGPKEDATAGVSCVVGIDDNGDGADAVAAAAGDMMLIDGVLLCEGG